MKVIFLFPRRTFRGDFDSSIHITRLVGRGEETYLQKKRFWSNTSVVPNSTTTIHILNYSYLRNYLEFRGHPLIVLNVKKLDITILTSIVLLQKTKRNKTYVKTQIKFEAIYLQHLESAPPYIYSISYISRTDLS